VPTPIELLADKTFEDIFVGGYFNIVKTGTHNVHITNHKVDGEYYGWGANSGALSIGDTDQKTVPQLINDFKDKKIKKLSAGNSHCLCLLEDGQVYAWGFNRAGQLGLGDFKNVANMTLVTALKDLQVADVFTAANSSLCLTQDGQIYVWGSNMQGELGLGDKKHRNTPTLLPFESPVKKVWASSSSSHWFVQLENEKIFGIGRNDKGQLGTADGTKFVPVELPELQGKVTNISAGSHHTFVWLS
jgi:alpha-tubulin suppressor-like RCC1 family protein